MSTKRKAEEDLEDKRVVVKAKTLPSNLYDWRVKWTQILFEASPLLKNICVMIAEFMPDKTDWTAFEVHRGMTVFDKKEGTWFMSTPTGMIITETYVNDVLHGPRFAFKEFVTMYENGVPVEERRFCAKWGHGKPVWFVTPLNANGVRLGGGHIELVE